MVRTEEKCKLTQHLFYYYFHFRKLHLINHKRIKNSGFISLLNNMQPLLMSLVEYMEPKSICTNIE